jgi:hypothetical protein
MRFFFVSIAKQNEKTKLFYKNIRLQALIYVCIKTRHCRFSQSSSEYIYIIINII